ncbi:MAG: radical SAM protein [bacterium]
MSHFPNAKTVYGPVKSWRFGLSLGIDPIFETSTCSFNCVYCQLGQIQDITSKHKVYVATERVLSDFKEILDAGTKIDVLTYSGSGEPTLAANLKEMIKGIRLIAPKLPQYILTNATELHVPAVREALKLLDKVIVKIDAADEELFSRVNRPAKGITLKSVLAGIHQFKSEYGGEIEVQSMFMPMNDKEFDDYATIIKEINPVAVQLNTPKRPYPLSWHRENRGNHEGIFDYEVRELKVITPDRAKEIETRLTEATGLKILSVYR